MKLTRRYILAAALVGLMGLGMHAQNSLPAPGSGGGFSPAPAGPPAPMPGPGYGPGPFWGSPWYDTYNPIVVTTPVYINNVNSGKVNVVACGYDSMGVWRNIPIRVAYTYNGVQYNARVLNAWDPWTDSWNMGVDVPAFHCSYNLNGTNYKFYVTLSTGTFYFNL